MAFCLTNKTYQQNNSQMPQGTTIIRLVNGTNTSRPFLRILDEQHIILNNFDSLISPNPFKKYRSATKSFESKSNPSMSPVLSPCSASSDFEGPCNLFIRKAASEAVSPVGILKDGSRSRFSRSSTKNCTFTPLRRVQIITD